MTDVAFAGLAEHAAMLERGETTSQELTELFLSRIERHDPVLNAFRVVFDELARAEAAQADARRRSGDKRPLLGLPLAIKDDTDIQGHVTAMGSCAVEEPARADSEVVRRLRSAGAVILGKTHVPEMMIVPFTESPTFGITRNPWDLQRTPGGSSGGSAAAVAAGLCSAALGSDGGGSIRIPAACCGLFGLKPQRGRVPRAPHDRDGSRWIAFGALTRSVLDGALVLDALHGPMPGDQDPLPAPPATFAQAAATPPPKLRIAVSDAFPTGGLGRLQADVRRALEETAALLRDLGHDVVERRVAPDARDAPVIIGLLFRGVRDLVAEAELPHRLERRTRAFARPGRLVSDRAHVKLADAERRMVQRALAAFEDHDVVVSPVLSQPAVRAGAMEGRGATVTYFWETGWAPFNVLWNSTGQPAASVPAGFTASGLPLAVQLVGRPCAEATLLSLAAQLEAARPWADRRPPCGAA